MDGVERTGRSEKRNKKAMMSKAGEDPRLRVLVSPSRSQRKKKMKQSGDANKTPKWVKMKTLGNPIDVSPSRARPFGVGIGTPSSSFSGRLKSVSTIAQCGLVTMEEKARLKDLLLTENEDVTSALDEYEETGNVQGVLGALSCAPPMPPRQRELQNEDSMSRSIDDLALNVHTTKGFSVENTPSQAMPCGRSSLKLPKSPRHQTPNGSTHLASYLQSMDDNGVNASPPRCRISSSLSSQSTVVGGDSQSPLEEMLRHQSPSHRRIAPSLSSQSTVISSQSNSPAFCHLEDSRSVSGVVFDQRMCLHRIANFCKAHEECPERIMEIYHALKQNGLWERFNTIPTRVATTSELCLAHEERHCIDMSKLSNSDHRAERETTLWSNSVYCNEHTYFAATLSCGSLLCLVDAVLDGTVRNGMALIRPPGHHAEHNEAMGFCIFNNCAVAAQYARQKFGLERVLIVDWDIHHGNGIQNIFAEDPNVLYFSVHRYDNGQFYPGGKNGSPTEVGVGDGEGYNINIGWNAKNMGDHEYLAAWMHVLMPIAYEFAPDLVIVAAGFDAAQGDPLGRCSVTPAGYGHLLHQMMGLAEGKVIVALEGGYNLDAVSNSSVACARVLLGDPPPLLRPGVPKPSAMRAIRQTLSVHEQYWYSVGGIFEKKKGAGLSKRERVLQSLGVVLNSDGETVESDEEETSKYRQSSRCGRTAESDVDGGEKCDTQQVDCKGGVSGRRSSNRSRKTKQVFDL
eukprot:Stramenopile-MAST_4_protein_3371